MKKVSRTRNFAIVFLTLNLLLPFSAATSAQRDLPEVLVLHSIRTTNPANTDWYLGILQGLTAGSDRQIQIDVEAPDFSRFDDTMYMRIDSLLT